MSRALEQFLRVMAAEKNYDDDDDDGTMGKAAVVPAAADQVVILDDEIIMNNQMTTESLGESSSHENENTLGDLIIDPPTLHSSSGHR